jgi:hypothetical protein
MATTWDNFIDEDTRAELESAVSDLFASAVPDHIADHVLRTGVRVGVPTAPIATDQYRGARAKLYGRRGGDAYLAAHGSPSAMCFPDAEERTAAIEFALVRLGKTDPVLEKETRAWLASREKLLSDLTDDLEAAQDEPIDSMSDERYAHLLRASLASGLLATGGGDGGSCIDATVAAALDLRHAMAVSSSLLIPDGSSPIVDALWAAVEDKLGLKAGHGYHTQALVYAPGEMYDTHTDCDEARISGDGAALAYSASQRKNDRAVTVLVYLTQSEGGGGETVFGSPFGTGKPCVATSFSGFFFFFFFFFFFSFLFFFLLLLVLSHGSIPRAHTLTIRNQISVR